MVDWQALKALKPTDPVKDLERRAPAFCARYAGVEDEFGFSLTTYAWSFPIFRFLLEDYFKVKYHGIHNIPDSGKALVIGNHSGLIPLDGALLTCGLINYHSTPRPVRFLATDWFFNLPGVSDWMRQTGQVRATLENAQKLLERDELVGIYPEGIRGVGKTYRERYRVHDFHPGFVQLAISSQTPVIPIATIGGDEILPNFANVKTLKQLFHMPFFPITPAFPFLPFPTPFVPLPVKWLMKIHKPIDFGYPPERANDRKLVRQLAKEVQYTIQKDLNDLLRERKPLFAEWEDD